MLKDVCKYMLQWVESNLYTGKNIQSLASSVGYSKKTIETWFCEEYGITIGSYLFRRRMSRASVLLRLTYLSVTEIATLLNYSSSQNFARAFRKFTGSTPTKYRNADSWDVSTMQPSLLYSFGIENIHLCSFPERYFSGVESHVTESFFYNQNKRELVGIRDLVNNLGNDARDDIFILVDRMNQTDLQRGRNGFIDVDIKVGNITPDAGEGDFVIAGGTYCYAHFQGEWFYYYLFTFSFFIYILSNNEFRYSGDGCYIHFYSRNRESSDVINCTMYIPVIT